MRFTVAASSLILSCLAAAVSAESVALLIGNEDYDRLNDVRRADDVARAALSLDRAGVRTIARRDASMDDMRAALSEFGQMVGSSDTLIVVLSGRFVHTATETYFLPTDGDAGPLASLSSRALPLSTVTAWLAGAPGQAVLILSTDELSGAYSAYVQSGIGDIELPQGVTMLTGAPAATRRFIEDVVSQPDARLIAEAADDNMTVSGFAPRDFVILQAPTPEVVEETPPQQPSNEFTRLNDIRAWRNADNANTPEAYQDYIEQNPGGAFVRMAQNRIQALTDTPEARAERIEQSLDLNRDQRREIQRDLSLLDFNTRGIDGIFGRGTRAAIASWQQAQGFDATGFLSREQITRLDAQAERRAAELEAEAERRRAEQLAADRAFWDETGARGDEPGLRAYIGRYPDGEYSEIAKERLAQIERQKRRDTNARDRQLWDEASRENTAAAYGDYLELSPQGAFRDEAADRIKAMRDQQQNAQANSAAARQEQALNLTPRTRQVIESRLDALDLRPGKVDGQFDANTRRAIRRYQSARGMEPTGYLNEKVVVQLMADTVRSIFR